MILKQYYLGCLAHASYLLGDEATSTAIIVDPQRDIHQYLADAEKFAAFLDQPLSQLEMARQGDMSVMTNDAPGEVKNDSYDAIFTTQLETARDRAVVPNYALLDTDFSDVLQKILAGKVSVDAGLAQAAGQANKALSSS